MNSYILLALSWLAYFFVHSLLATPGAKRFFKMAFGSAYRYYRLIYVIFAIITLLPVIYYTALLSSEPVLNPKAKEIARYAGMVLATYGVIVVRRSFRSYSLKQFLGLGSHTDAQPTHQLVTDGMLKHVRHPLYAGTLLLFAGFWLFSPTIANGIMVVLTFLYTFIGIALEEKRLIQEFGQSYVEYKKRVPMLIPRFKKRHS